MGPSSDWTGGKSRSLRDSIPDRPARSSVAIPTEPPGTRPSTYSLIYFAVSLAKGPQPLSKLFLQRVRSSASAFKFQ